MLGDRDMVTTAKLGIRYASLIAGYFAGAYTLYLFDYSVTQPHPVYLDGTTWLRYAVREGFIWSLWCSICIGILFPIGLALQKSPRDLAFYPIVRHFPLLLRSLGSRLVIIAGGLLLGGYLCSVAIMVWGAAHTPHGLIWPPHFIYAVSMSLWGLWWMADCVTRPRRGSVVAAVIFTVFAVLFIAPGVTVLLVE